MLNQSKFLMNEKVQDNSQKMQEKLCEILATMEQHEQFRFKHKKLPQINDEFIQKQISGMERTFGDVLDNYVRNLIVQTVNVGAQITREHFGRVH